ncbi:MAG: glutamate--tRNA ligase [Acidimicrobiia bacterium]|nr:glutamate--tRNA ligase [Acidimicrobiia bacterium]MBP8181704.1 glutamate--tRNA ligase [Acidimicrobiia bacterium]
MTQTPRVRFAPAPTGSLHVGGARTALFNWLFARHNGGTFVLRIEDTDAERSRQEWVQAIRDGLSWLGLSWDEEYRQSERVDKYQVAIDQLLADGNAYECYCTPAQLDERAEAARAAGRAPGYDGTCRDLSEADRAARRAEAQAVTVRFKVPRQGVSTFTDIVRGEVSVAWDTIADFVIRRSSGEAVFYVANAVDDADMGITHVIRGEDLLDSTHRVLAIRHALGHANDPLFAHLPLLVGADRSKLSKRHGAVAMAAFAEGGYLPAALTNYIALLGFPAEDGQEIQTIDELVGAFDLERVNRSAAFFDYEKLGWMNAEYIRALTPDEFVAAVSPYVLERYGNVAADALNEAAALAQGRSRTLVEAADQMGFLFRSDDEFAISPDAWVRATKLENWRQVIEAARTHIETCEWTPDGVDLRPALTDLDVKPRKGMPVLYAAIEGNDRGLPLFESIVLLGRERTLDRLTAALEGPALADPSDDGTTPDGTDR